MTHNPDLIDRLAWDRMDGLLPAIVQHAASGEVRMLGYMDREALGRTLASGYVTFFSRSRQSYWQKGESSGNRLALVSVAPDCDGDALLVQAFPEGPTCHTGASSCFGRDGAPGVGFVAELEQLLRKRASDDPQSSYTASLVSAGIKRIAQKVGEEGVETALAAMAGDRVELTDEAADLVYHLTLLLHVGGSNWNDVVDVLKKRHEIRATASS
jgi:phosphoribosyl-ATP pyrophosphohydrolase/phosphoribosyl-AMP cyclohydrolase